MPLSMTCDAPGCTATLSPLRLTTHGRLDGLGKWWALARADRAVCACSIAHIDAAMKAAVVVVGE